MRRQLERIEQFAVAVIFERQTGKRAMFLRGVLRAASWLYGGVVRVRVALFQGNLFRRHYLGCTVVSVGNLTVGGTGKTPVVERLARELRDAGCKVAILSRGYKSRRLPLLRAWRAKLTGQSHPLLGTRIVSDGHSVLLDSYTAGDEPHMLARNLPGVPVIVDKDRARAGCVAVERFGAHVLLLDDGFQYLRLARRHDIVLVDCQAPFGNGFLLPRGMLRESPRALRRAQLVVLTKAGGRDQSELIGQIRKYQAAAPIVVCDHQPLYLQRIGGEGREPLDFLQGKFVAALSGIAAPDSFERFLLQHGADLVVRRRYADHHRYNEAEIRELIERCRRRDLQAVITTEKDAVRLPLPPGCEDVPFYFLKVEIELQSGQEEWKQWLLRLADPAQHTGKMAGRYLPATPPVKKAAGAT